MQTNISGHHLALTPALRAYVNKITNRLNSSFSGITNTQVTLTKENIQYIAELMLHMRGVDIKATSMSKDMYAALDSLPRKVIKQILKFKGKKRKSRHKHINDSLDQGTDEEVDL